MPPDVFPKHGAAKADILDEMTALKKDDVDWRGGRLGVYVHFAGDEVLEIAKEAHHLYFSENALGPAAFPSLRRLEDDVVGWTLGLLGGSPRACGNMTSGGTESIFMAVKTARDRARAEGLGGGDRLRMVVPYSAHPAFSKAAHFLDVDLERVPLRDDFTADPVGLAAAVDDRTFMLVASAPSFPHGVFDPIEEIAALARERNLWLHVDACVGGFVAPFARIAGYPVPDFDLRVPGVTSVSADLHKYGFTAKGASTILFADEALREYQMFEFEDWPRGRYVSPTFAGTRPGGPIAAAWAVIRFLGEEGYVELVRQTMAARDRLLAGIRSINGLVVWGEPSLSVVAFGSENPEGLDIFAVAEAMTRRGWFVTRGAQPPAIHLGMLTPAHAPVVSQYVSDLESAVQEVRRDRLTAADRSATYG